MIQNKLLERCQEIIPELIKIRRDIYSQCELPSKSCGQRELDYYPAEMVEMGQIRQTQKTLNG